MDRSQWLTMVYREANLLLERQQSAGHPVTLEEVEDLDPEIHVQVQEVLEHCTDLEDLIKHSVLKHPPAELWQSEDSWARVLIAVAAECVVYDVKGVSKKILAGDLPRMASHTLHEPVPPSSSQSDAPPAKPKAPIDPRRQAIKDVDPDDDPDADGMDDGNG